MLSNKQKAVAAFIVTLLTSAGTAILTAFNSIGEGATFADLTQGAWVTIILAVLVSTGLTTGAVYQVANKPKIATQTPDGAHRITDVE